jgi:general secretion pathway protein I
MILRHTPGARRPGLSLMEVLVALSIFLLSFAVLSQLISLASERAHDVEMRTRAAQLCQSKMNEVNSGLVPLSSVENTPFDEDGDWQWSLDAEQSSNVPGLWTVTVHVSRTNPDGLQANTELWGMLLDPSQRGNAMDTITVTSSTSTSSSSSSSSSSSGSSSSTTPSGSSTTSPSTATPSVTPATGGTPSSGGNSGANKPTTPSGGNGGNGGGRAGPTKTGP